MLRAVLVSLVLAAPAAAATDYFAGSYDQGYSSQVDLFTGTASGVLATPPAESSYANAGRGIAASSRAQTTVYRAAASLSAPSNDLSSLKSFDYGHPSRGQSGSLFVGGSIYVFNAAKGEASFSDSFVAPADADYTFSTFFDRTVSSTFVPDLKAITFYIGGFAGYWGISSDQPITMDVAKITSLARFSVRIEDAANSQSFIQFETGSRRASGLTVVSTLNRIDGGSYDSSPIEEAYNYSAVFVGDGLGGLAQDYQRFDQPVSGPLSASGYTTAALSYRMLQGHSYKTSFGVTCLVEADDAGYFSPGSGGVCDASQSAYWGGIASARGLDGKPITGLNLVGGSGFNFGLPSPDVPYLPGGNAVPEPETWALLVLGFGLAGATDRRRRAARAARSAAHDGAQDER